jgi:aspartate dehydrogenase
MIKMKVGLVGCGNIGADLCIALQKRKIPAVLAALTDIDQTRAKVLQRSFQLNADICSIEENAAQVDFLVECAWPSAVPELVDAAMRHQVDCLIMSVGGLIQHPDLWEEARARGCRIYIPSGAVCGLDGIRSAMEAGLHHVTITTRKPPRAFEGSPYLVQHNIDVSNLREPKVIFEGTAMDAVTYFPRNLNVAAALSLAGVGPIETRVRVIADPTTTVNSHEIVAEGAFGRLKTVAENLPSPRNPKSSYLASLSAIAELRHAAEAFVARHCSTG